MTKTLDDCSTPELLTFYQRLYDKQVSAIPDRDKLLHSIRAKTEGVPLGDVVMDTKLGKVYFTRFTLPIVSEQQAYKGVREALGHPIDSATLLSLSPEPRVLVATTAVLRDTNDVFLALASLESIGTTFIDRPMPPDDPEMLRVLLQRLGLDLANRLGEMFKLEGDVLGNVINIDEFSAAFPISWTLLREQPTAEEAAARGSLMATLEEPIEDIAIRVADYVAQHGGIEESSVISLLTTVGVMRICLPRQALSA